MQPHGALLALDRLGRLSHASANASELLDVPLPFGRVICEFERRAADAGEVSTFAHLAYRAMDTLKRQRSIERLLDAAVLAVRQVTGFDRVMAYRFGHDDSGGVVAEARSDVEYTSPHTTILKPDLTVVKRLLTDDDLGGEVWPALHGVPEHCNVDRATLRQILLSGLEGRVRFGKRLVRHESNAHGVTAFFDDGSEMEGAVLVGADGIRSCVRAGRAPHAQTMNAGVVAIYGRLPTVAALKSVPAETLGDIFTVATDDRKVFLGMGSVRFPVRPDDAGARLAGIPLMERDDYLVCIVGGRPQFFTGDLDTLRRANSPELQEIAAQAVADWPESTIAVLRQGDPSSFFLVEMHTCVPCQLDDPVNVTLLGDAIHGTTPTLGRRANVAMRDGVTLGRALEETVAGRPLADALAAYVTAMLRYGFDVFRKAALTGEQRMAQDPLPF